MTIETNKLVQNRRKKKRVLPNCPEEIEEETGPYPNKLTDELALA